MGFLDHSTNNIIVDAVLTDVGREKLASATTAENFVAAYAFADDEVDYLLVSDGVFSNTKSVIEKKLFQTNYYGAVAIRTQIDNKDINNFDTNNISLIMGSNAHLVLYPVNQKKEINLVCIIKKKLKEENSIKNILENTIYKENNGLINLFKDMMIWKQ